MVEEVEGKWLLGSLEEGSRRRKVPTMDLIGGAEDAKEHFIGGGRVVRGLGSRASAEGDAWRLRQ